MCNFGSNVFVTIIGVIVTLMAHSVNSAAIPKHARDEWPDDIHLDESNWMNSCNLSFSTISGIKINVSLNKILLTVEQLEANFNSGRKTVLNIHNDTARLGHRFEAMPKFNKTVPFKKLLRDIHKSVQQYVGLFDTLSSRFSYIDSLKQNSTKEFSTEMRYFLNESKLLLCEIETSLNVSSHSAQYISRAEMQRKILKMARSLNKENKASRLNELDAFYAKKYFYEYIVGLGKYLRAREIKQQRSNRNRSNNSSGANKKALKKRKMNNNRKLVTDDLNNSNAASESSAVTPQKRHRNKQTSASTEKKQKRLNNKNKLNSSGSKKNKSQEGGKQVKSRVRHANKSTPPSAVA